MSDCYLYGMGLGVVIGLFIRMLSDVWIDDSEEEV